MFQRSYPEVTGQRLPQVSEAVACTKIQWCRYITTDEEQWNMLAGVIGAGPGGIAAMVSAHREHVSRLEALQQLRQEAVESFKCIGIAGGVASVAVEHVEID